MKKRTVWIGSVILFIASLTLVFVYAQQVQKRASFVAAADIKEEVNDEVETAGIPTGDDPWTEMGKLVSSYYSEQGMFYKGIVRLIDDNGDDEKVLEVHPFEYTFFNGDFHYSLDSMEFISQRGNVLAADHRGKLISFAAGSEPTSSARLFDIGEFKKLVEEQKAHALVTEAGGEKMLTIDSIQDARIQGYRIYYNPQTYKISKMLIGMVRLQSLDAGEEEASQDTNAPGNKIKNDEEVEEIAGIETYSYYVEIIYQQGRSLLLKKGQFDPVQQFVKITGTNIELQPAYNKYELINTTGDGDSR